MSMFGFFSGLLLGVFITGLCYRVVMADPCIVRIHTNPFIKRMVAARRVACFRGASNLEEELKSANDTYDVVEKCAKLARAKHYKMFALGRDGLCLSGADTENRYHISGPEGTGCKDGIGKGDSMFVYSWDPLPDLQPLGCYMDNGGDRALPNEYANFRSQMNWEQLETVQQCAQVAFNKGYEYFAVQYYGECYTGNDASQTYYKHGKSDRCVEIDKTLGFRVGQADTNYVYRININATHDQI